MGVLQGETVKPLIALLILCGSALANTCASAGTGNWQDASKWSSCGGTYPQAGDTATIAAGHTITIPANETDTLGTAGGSSGVNVLTIAQNTGVLVINGTLHFDGDLMQQGTITMGPDSVMEFSSDVARVWHSDTNFGATAGNNNLIQTSGTSAAHPFTIRSTTGGTPVSVTANNRAANKMNMSFGTFLRVGSSTLNATQFAYGGGSSAVYQHTVTLTSVTFDTCGQVRWLNGAPSGAGWAFSDVHFVSSQPTNPLLLNAVAASTGTRTVDKTSFDKPPLIIGANSTYTRNVFMRGWSNTSHATNWAQFGEAAYGDGMGNFIRCDNTTNTGNIAGDIKGNYILIDSGNAAAVTGTVTSATSGSPSGTLVDNTKTWTLNQYQNSTSNSWFVLVTGGTGVGQARSILSNTTGGSLTTLYPWAVTPVAGSTYAIVKGLGNPHVINGINNLNGTAVSLSLNVIENTGVDNNGDLWSHVTKASTTYTIDGNLVIPNAARDSSVDVVSLDDAGGASPIPTVSLTHNTFWVGGQAGILVDDGTTTATGAVLLWRSNLTASDPALTNTYAIVGSGSSASGLGPYHIGSSLGGSTDAVDAANVTYNGRWGLKAGSELKGYNLNLTGTPDATGSVSANPQFYDDTRNFAVCTRRLGYSASLNNLTAISDGLTAIAADGSRVPLYIACVREGFAPTNTDYRFAAHDGTTIGAIPWSAPSFPPAMLQTSMIVW